MTMIRGGRRPWIPTRRNILATGAAAAAMAAMPRVFAQQAGKGGTGKFYEKGPVRIHYRGGRVRLPADAASRRGIELDDRRSSPATRPSTRSRSSRDEYRCIAADLRNANSGQSTGPLEVDRPWDVLRRRPARPDGSPGHRQVHGDGLLHRRPLHLESPEARAQSCCRGRAGAAQRVAAGDARPVLRHQHEGLGSGTDRRSGPRSRWRRSTNS